MSVPERLYIVWDAGETWEESPCPGLIGVFTSVEKAMGSVAVMTAGHRIEATDLNGGWVSTTQVKQATDVMVNGGYSKCVWKDYPGPPLKPTYDPDSVVQDW